MIQYLLCLDSDLCLQARVLAETLSLPFAREHKEIADQELVLLVDRSGIGLVTLKKGKILSKLQVDFTAGKARHRRLFGNNESSDLIKAIGSKEARVLDATAGLGQDSFALASLGCRVTLCERNPIIRTLLQDGMRRGLDDAESATILKRMVVLPEDAFQVLQQLTDPRLADNRPDVIYLDPMYPERKKSALVKKEMRWLKDIVGADDDASDLLPLAQKIVCNRVVVKRMRKAPCLGGTPPSFAIEGKTTRFDVYLAAI